MTNEEIYDQQIAPLLLQAGQIAKQHNIDFIAVVDIADDEDPHAIASTATFGNKPQAAMSLIRHAMLAKGNFDKLVIDVFREQKGRPHQSAYLKILENQ